MTSISYQDEEILHRVFDYVELVVESYEKLIGKVLPHEQWAADYVYECFKQMINYVYMSNDIPSNGITYMRRKQEKRISLIMRILDWLLHHIPNIMGFIIRNELPSEVPADICMDFCQLIVMMQVCVFDDSPSVIGRHRISLVHGHKRAKLPGSIGSDVTYLDDIVTASGYAVNILFRKLMNIRINENKNVSLPMFPIMFTQYIYGEDDRGTQQYNYCETDVFMYMLTYCENDACVNIKRDDAEEESGSDG